MYLKTGYRQDFPYQKKTEPGVLSIALFKDQLFFFVSDAASVVFAYEDNPMRSLICVE